MPASPPHAGARFRMPSWRDFRPTRGAWLLVAGAFALGLLLFLLLWLDQRQNRDFYQPPVARPTATPQFAPLPAPLPAGESRRSASGLGELPERAPGQEPRPRLVEPPRPPPAPEPSPPPRPVAADMPVPVSTPTPRYPPTALRRGESGTVLVRVEVGPDGMPTAVEVERSSRSRALDRAAVDAVRRWRFRPAMADGHPVAGSVVVPIDFKLDR